MSSLGIVTVKPISSSQIGGKSTATPLGSIYFNQEVYDVQARTDFDTDFRALGWFRMHWKIIN